MSDRLQESERARSFNPLIAAPIAAGFFKSHGRSAQPPAAELSAQELSVHFQGLAALSEVSLTVYRRQICGLIGPNGAGKTTLVNCLTGFQPSSSGRVLLGSHDTAGWSPKHFRRSGIARTFQSGRLFKDLTVFENVEVAAVAMGSSRRAAAAHTTAVLEWLGLASRISRIAGTLPYVDERRVGIARALIMAPAFLLLDEPAAGMSDAECDELMHIVRQIPNVFGCGVLLIEHNMRVVMGVCDRVHVLDGGYTIAEGPPAEIQKHPDVIAAYLGVDG